MSYFEIDGQKIDVGLVKIEETYNILDGENAGRVINKGRMNFDTIGMFPSHKITFTRKNNDKASLKAFDILFDICRNPNKRNHFIKAVDNQTTISYEAYCGSGTRALERIDESGNVYWGQLVVNFIAIEAQEV